MWDLDRRRDRLKGFASSLEQIVSGNARERGRSLRRLSVSAFASHRILDGLEREIAMLEQDNGIDVLDSAKSISLFFRKAKQIDRRLAVLEQKGDVS